MCWSIDSNGFLEAVSNRFDLKIRKKIVEFMVKKNVMSVEFKVYASQ